MSHLPAALKIAFKALRTNKMRSALTMLGMVVGVGAVIAMVAVGQGASERVQNQIESLGSNLIVVQPGWNNTGGVRNGFGNSVTLTRDDADAIASELPSVAHVAASVRGNAQVVYSGSNWFTRIEGVTRDYFTVRNYDVNRGAPFVDADDQGARKVALIGQTVVDQLFPGADPVGASIRINNVPFTVVGTLKPKGQSPSGEDQDDTILVPLTTAKRKLLGRSWANAKSVRNVYVQARSAEATPLAEQQIGELLRLRHKLRPDQDNDFQVRNLTSGFEAQQESTAVMSLLLASIASVSLFVGGVGIMNIMLVSVTERTKEIGLRQAVGARTRHILSQFLVEAMTLSVLGGLLGIALGIVASHVISRVAGWQTLVSFTAVLGAFVFSAFVGIFFGYYPARKAANLDPIDALRYE
ncbi:MAG TPA: ABC transporter permease [Bryobacteraceae bacterium]|jgi:putative ABC transport system permease protein|nr:ABC transporter permease [Bryobacteraceae bacterium]